MTWNYTTPIGLALLFTFLLFQPVAAYAVNGQSPNYQVLSSNTSNDSYTLENSNCNYGSISTNQFYNMGTQSYSC